jgi:hypothetical protein
MLRAAEAFLIARAFIRQIDDFRVITELVVEEGFKGLNLG